MVASRSANTLLKDAYNLVLTLLKADSVFSGITTFGRLPYQQCLGNPDIDYDIAFIGMQYHSTN